MTDATQAGTCSVRHAMLLYRDPGELVRACADYIGADTMRSAVLVAGRGDYIDLLRSWLGSASWQVEMTELPQLAADPGRMLAAIRTFAVRNAGRPLRLVQEVGWYGRPQEDMTEALGYETLVCRALEGTDASVLCGYDARLGPGVLAAAERVHPEVLDNGWRHSALFGADTHDGALAAALSSPPQGASSLAFRSDQAAVRRFAEIQGRQAGLSPSRVMDLVIAVGELAANTLRHTDDMGELTIWRSSSEVICQVSDHGQITDPLAGTIQPDPVAMGSKRGLWLVHQIGDLVQVRSGASGTTVRVHLRYSADAPTAN